MLEILCSLPLIAGLLGQCPAPEVLANGYVEGEYLLIAPSGTAQIDNVAVRRGDRVSAGQAIAQMERRDAEIARAEAAAGLARAKSNLANLNEGRRAPEIQVIEAELASAIAEMREAQREADRQRGLFTRGSAPQAKVDEALTRLDIARSRVSEIRARLAVAKLPARKQEIAAAQAAVDQARAGLEAAQWRLDQRRIEAPASGVIFDVLRTAGEIAGPQAPILSMLPDGAVILRLYVPEKAVSTIAPGTVLQVRCDGCAPGTTATVSYVADNPEFTPPVIYSLENRQKLVYLVEARPDAASPVLKPGQIIDVALGSEK